MRRREGHAAIPGTGEGSVSRRRRAPSPSEPRPCNAACGMNSAWTTRSARWKPLRWAKWSAWASCSRRPARALAATVRRNKSSPRRAQPGAPPNRCWSFISGKRSASPRASARPARCHFPQGDVLQVKPVPEFLRAVIPTAAYQAAPRVREGPARRVLGQRPEPDQADRRGEARRAAAAFRPSADLRPRGLPGPSPAIRHGQPSSAQVAAACSPMRSFTRAGRSGASRCWWT